jgi:hypothetical protein
LNTINTYKNKNNHQIINLSNQKLNILPTSFSHYYYSSIYPSKTILKETSKKDIQQPSHNNNSSKLTKISKKSSPTSKESKSIAIKTFLKNLSLNLQILPNNPFLLNHYSSHTK